MSFPKALRRLTKTDLESSIRESGEVTILDLRGRATIEGESELLSGLKKVIAKGSCKLLLNLLDLTQIDCTGVSLIIETFVSLRKKGGELKLLCATGRVLEVLRVLRITKIIPPFETETQALASFRPQAYAPA